MPLPLDASVMIFMLDILLTFICNFLGYVCVSLLEYPK